MQKSVLNNQINCIPCLLWNKISREVNTNKDQKIPSNILVSNIFFHEDQLFSHKGKITHVPNGFLSTSNGIKATGNQTMLGSKPPVRCHYSNNGGKKDMFLKHLTCSKTEEQPCVVLTQQGRCQTLGIWRIGSSHMKGRVQSSDVVIIAESNVVEYTFLRHNFLTKEKTQLKLF